MMIDLTPEDWVEIYEALVSKLRSPAVYMDMAWTEHLLNIIDSIGGDGEEAAEYGVNPA
jgi:hypothetical protein